MGKHQSSAADAVVYATSLRSIKPLDTYYSSNLYLCAIVKDLTFAILTQEYAINCQSRVEMTSVEPDFHGQSASLRRKAWQSVLT